MLQNSIGTGWTFAGIALFSVFAGASSDDMQKATIARNLHPTQIFEICESSRTSWQSISLYNFKIGDYFRSESFAEPIDANSIKIQQRYQAINESFLKHSNDFPSEKKEYFDKLSNAICRLPFEDNISLYNKYDDAIDTVLKLSNGLKISISQFLDEDIFAPVVFSVHRGKDLLISDAMPIDEIVNIINSVMA